LPDFFEAFDLTDVVEDADGVTGSAQFDRSNVNIVRPLVDPIEFDPEIGSAVIVQCLLESLMKIDVSNDLR
jgi:hypothetical protein